MDMQVCAGDGKPEPDSEPETEHKEFLCSYVKEHADHREFVRGLRRKHCASPDSEHFWTLSDVEPSSAISVSLQELKRYFAEWQTRAKDPFWHRKSHQVVLAVVVCRRADGGFNIYRGMNTEVSLPAGSLCAERAGIARAASDLQAARDIVAVSVMDPYDRINPLWPCEVCQSWLAKLRDQSSAIKIMAVESPTCESFLVRVNGETELPPRHERPPSAELVGKVERTEEVEEWPWEAEELAYVDDSWAEMGSLQRHLLKLARSRGSHLLVGVHSDETLLKEQGTMPSEDFATRLERLLDNRHVSSVLKDAPWCVSDGLIRSLKIRRVITCEGVDTGQMCKDATTPGVYDAARRLGILEVIPASMLSSH